MTEMKDLIPDAAFIIKSGYQDFEYASRQPSICAWQTTCSNPSIRWEMGSILENSAPTHNQAKSWPTVFDSRWHLWKSFGRYIAGRNSLWIGVSKEKKALSARLTKFRAKSSTLYLRSKRRSHDWEGLWSLLIRSTFRQFKPSGAWSLYGATPLNQDEEVLHYYEPAYCDDVRKYPTDLRRTRLSWKNDSEKTIQGLCWPSSSYPIFDGCLSLLASKYLREGRPTADVVKKVQEAATFGEMISLSRKKCFLSQLSDERKCSEFRKD